MRATKYQLPAVIALLLWLPVSVAQEGTIAKDKPLPAPVEHTPAEPATPKDPLGRETPRGSLTGLLLAFDERDFMRATEYLDLRNLPSRYRSVKPALLANMLSVVIKREIWIDLENVSDNPKGAAGDGLPDYRDELGRVGKGDTEQVLLMQRVPGDDGQFIWKVSNATVANIADLYSEFGYNPITQAVADFMPDVSFLGLELFKWVIALGIGLITYPILAILGLGLARLFSNPTSPIYRRVRRFFIGPFALIIVVLIMDWVARDLGYGLTAQKFAEAATLNTLLLTWLLLSATGLLAHAYAGHLEKQGREGAMVFIRPAAQFIRILIVVVAVLGWLDNIGYDITTLLAGLGVGGVAVALALQKPLEDVFGALSLYTEQPMRIGDFCRIGNDLGTIEEIGLRTTRIRTLGNTLISIPNSRLSTEPIDNYSARQKILYNPTLRLRVDTSREQLSKLLDNIRALLSSHERVIQDGARIRFQTIGIDALELNIFAYTKTQNYPDYLEVAEDLNMKIMDIVADAGTTLAVPAHLIYAESGADNIS